MVRAMTTLGQIVRRERESRGWTQAQLGDRLNISQQSVASLEADELKRTPSYILKLIEVLELDPRQVPEINKPVEVKFTAGSSRAGDPLTKIQPNVGDFVASPPDPRLFPKDVPVYGTAVGGASGVFHLNGETIEYVRRPPGVADVVGVFAVYVQGDTMSPRFEPGDLVYVHPGRPPRNGDDVVVELHGVDGSPGDCYVKRLKNRTASKVILEQFNPSDTAVEFELTSIKNLYRIVPLGELLGM